MDEKTKKRNERLAAELYPQPNEHDTTFLRLSQLKTSPIIKEESILLNYKGIALLGALIPLPFLAAEWMLWRLLFDIGTIIGVMFVAFAGWLYLTLLCFWTYFFIKAILKKLNDLGVPDTRPLFYFYVFFMAPVAVCIQVLLGHDGWLLALTSILTVIVGGILLTTLARTLYSPQIPIEKRWHRAVGIVCVPYLAGLLFTLLVQFN